ncbi:MAG: DeoR/GlpR family DNA-binding transcription regulator [Propionibacteriaceae bacterium]|jgi:DeoR/GlpR family transcriptional regulator of sugar metabolism|nr:DeoR/GlpR family DNA-binding transcription regulator [Propionibacteriaceae bacterium]
MGLNRDNLIPDQRREQLMRLLRRETVLSVAQLTDRLGVSHMTVRRDISALEREGRAYSVPGGVRLASAMRIEPSFIAKSTVEPDQKVAIAGLAQASLRDDMVIFLDAGTTTGALLPALLEHTGLTVISCDFTIMDQLTGAGQIEAIHTGGRLDHTTRSAVGRLAAQTLRAINTDIAFLSTNAWDLQRGVTTPSEPKVDLKQAAIAGASTAVLLTTSSKFGTFGMYDVAPLTAFDRIITDDGLPAAAAQGVRDLGVSLELAAVAATGSTG